VKTEIYGSSLLFPGPIGLPSFIPCAFLKRKASLVRCEIRSRSISAAIEKVIAVPPFLSGFAVALGAGAQAVTRFFADPFVERYSPTTVSRVLLRVLGVAVLLVFFAPATGWRMSALR
jgi:hypothetical protein